MSYYPMNMQPCYKEALWGGCKLKKFFNKKDAPEVTAESWELSAHSGGMSTVSNGVLRGKSIAELGEINHDGFWGENCPDDRFPVLVKLIDARTNLSIQVHPSDKTAAWELGEQGKAEMWYIVDCEPKSYIYFGLSEKISKDEFRSRSKDGSICKVLNKVPVARGDVFFVLPGTIHAICAGIVIAEIQQSSDTTFRIYDYQRKDANGKMRTLHLEQAERVLDYDPIIPGECKATNSGVFENFTVTEMFSCEYFRAFRLDIHDWADFCCDGTTFHHLLCVKGTGELVHNDIRYPLRKGDSYFLPASLGKYRIEGQCKLLLTKI